MARFYGTIQGARGPTSRLGHANLHVTAQSYNGDVIVDFHRSTTDEDRDWVQIAVADHESGNRHILWNGHIHELLDMNARGAALVALATKTLGDER